jgi:hypothetical protein
MDGDQGGGARGVDGKTGALEAKRIGYPPRGGVQRHARQQIGVGLAGPLEPPAVVAVADADEDTGRRAVTGLRRNAGILQRPPCGFQQEAVLRIDHRRLARVDAEEVGIEPVDGVQEPAALGVHAAGRIGVGIVPGVDVPTVGRDVPDCAPALIVSAEAVHIGGPGRRKASRPTEMGSSRADSRASSGTCARGGRRAPVSRHRRGSFRAPGEVGFGGNYHPKPLSIYL